ncbi:SMP-30/gluconolactonase/LRE family protein [Cellulomonas endophytica]|uniref:SMP-30/gluconolactonase/LRE family protein n=1 Tax=Cellulomonas endophytica TaxID=2494735 RepID=UPI00101077F5|nr:SMP-30/gluconolactonase/LRE family protein [Cellulomonas endophytica]
MTTPPTGTVEPLTGPVAFHAEGPVWSPAWGGLRFVDMLAGDLLTVGADGAVDRLHVGDVAAFVRPRARGGYVVGLERGLGLAERVDEPPRALPPLWEDPAVRLNEGGCDTAGNLYAGSMAYEGTPGAARLYRVTPSLEVSVVVPDATVSNGIDLSPDGTLAYYDDTHTHRTDVFTVQDGRLRDRRPWRDWGEGRPDGLTVDAAGNVWVAFYGDGVVRLSSPEGRTLAEVGLPGANTTACALGGPDGRDLFVTTSREGLEAPGEADGAVFRVRVEVPGKPVLPFGG